MANQVAEPVVVAEETGVEEQDWLMDVETTQPVGKACLLADPDCEACQ